ncbi:spore germination protein [Paenibacillus sp. M1]|uniref:Spore germination protein n=1 Tax=Paenibacillus haidiansis TaxID=1574488 RepID=A0ABU7VTV3_9BACL
MNKFLTRTSGENKDSSSARRAPLYTGLEENLAYLRDKLGPSADLNIRSLSYIADKSPAAVAVFMSGLTDKTAVNAILSSFLDEMNNSGDTSSELPDLANIKAGLMGHVQPVRDFDEVILGILSGETIIMLEGSGEALSCNTQGSEQRAVEEPSSQVVIRGPKDGFNESIGTNVALVRKRIKSGNLWLEKMSIGKVTHTDVAILYLKGTAGEGVVAEVKKRLNAIDYDSILESGYIENFIQDKAITPFPTLYNTERPDTVAANLLEGRVAIFVDGTPFVLIAPTTFFMFFQAAEDYYQRSDVSTAIRLLRYFALFISLFGPSIYIAAITFHYELIPTQLLISLATQQETVPFPALVEVLIMEVTFEILREAGVRMPRAIGQAVSIVGALVLGQAAVQAGIVSSAMVIVVALTGISSFSTPSFNMALSIRLLRFACMIFATFIGFFGIVVFSMLLVAHLCGLQSFGVSYMAPATPFNLERQKDALIRFGFNKVTSHSKAVRSEESNRESTQ